MYSCGIFIDLQIIYTVNHFILLWKLEHYGILDQKQTVQVGNNISDNETTLAGVPQKSVLGHYYL